MVILRTFEYPGLKVELRLNTTDGEAHSKAVDNLDIIADALDNIGFVVQLASSELAAIPLKATRLAEGCK